MILTLMSAFNLVHSGGRKRREHWVIQPKGSPLDQCLWVELLLNPVPVVMEWIFLRSGKRAQSKKSLAFPSLHQRTFFSFLKAQLRCHLLHEASPTAIRSHLISNFSKFLWHMTYKLAYIWFHIVLCLISRIRF